ncbi:MAG TPA: O-antigen ligase family protein [Terracidiphilus sp.]|jgi:O-antigen ligase
MRRIAWVLLLIFAFAIPWEYSLELGEPLGNIARVVGLLLLLVAIPAVFQAGRLRTPGTMLWLVLALYLWFCCTCFWTIEPLATLTKLRGYFQEMMIVWLVWEFAESADDLRALMRAYIAGSWVLAALTLANYVSTDAMTNQQVRFVATGQDPNDVARFLNLAFPLAALLVNSEQKWPWRLLAAGYFPLGLVAVLLTASRGGFLEVMVALAGSGILLGYGHPKRVWAGALALPPLAALIWWIVPRGSLERLATINEQLQGGGLNLRWNIWTAGWHAFVKAPLFGTGAGSFVSAAGLSPIDTAHNAALSIAVGGGLVALFLAVAIVAVVVWSLIQTKGPLRWALALTLVIWGITSMVATVEENRTSWLLLAMITLAGRLAAEEPERLEECFPAVVSRRELLAASEPM